jgi:hypothetical protein
MPEIQKELNLDAGTLNSHIHGSAKIISMSRSSIVRAILGIGIVALIGFIVWRVVPEYFKAREDPRSQAHLARVAAELNRSVPVMIDQETELLPSQGVEGLFIYNYRLVSYSAAQIDAKKFVTGAKQRLIQGACNTPETRDDFLKKGVTLRYSYYDKDKQPIATVDITPADCGF